MLHLLLASLLVLAGLGPAAAADTPIVPAAGDETLSIDRRSRYGVTVSNQLADRTSQVELKSGRLSGMKGDVEIAVVIGRNGALVDSRVVQSSGYQEIDQFALDTVRRAAPFPRFPPELKAFQVRMVLPLGFQLK